MTHLRHQRDHEQGDEAGDVVGAQLTDRQSLSDHQPVAPHDDEQENRAGEHPAAEAHELLRVFALPGEARTANREHCVRRNQTDCTREELTCHERPDRVIQPCAGDHDREARELDDEIEQDQAPERHVSGCDELAGRLESFEDHPSAGHRQQRDQGRLSVPARDRSGQERQRAVQQNTAQGVDRPRGVQQISIGRVLALDERLDDSGVGDHLQPDQQRVYDGHESEGLGIQQSSDDQVGSETERLTQSVAAGRPDHALGDCAVPAFVESLPARGVPRRHLRAHEGGFRGASWLLEVRCHSASGRALATIRPSSGSFQSR